MHPLDNPIWHALCGPQKVLSFGTNRAKRFLPEVSPFAACEDHSALSLAELASVVQPQGVVATLTTTALVLSDPKTAPLWETMRTQVIAQMELVENVTMPSLALEVLNEADVPAMLALTDQTHPGPFFAGTIRMGRYLGLRDNGQLVAMAGERLKPQGHVELSAVCTHPAQQGKGHGTALVQAVCCGILEQGQVPFLHVKTENTAALRVYEKLGFKQRRLMHLSVLRCINLP